MLLCEADRPESQAETLNGPLSCPFQNGLFVDMQTGGNGAFIKQGRFYLFHGRSGSHRNPRADALRRALARNGSGSDLDNFVSIGRKHIEPSIGLSPADHPLVVLGDDPHRVAHVFR